MSYVVVSILYIYLPHKPVSDWPKMSQKKDDLIADLCFVLTVEIYHLGDSMNQETNVKAIMSSYKIWEETSVLNPLLGRIKEVVFNYDHRISPNQTYFLNDAWSTIYKGGNYTKSHSHGSTYLSFVYYLKTPEPYTPLIFDKINFKLHPLEDMLIIFPGYVFHSVPPHQSKEDRICVAGNFVGVNN